MGMPCHSVPLRGEGARAGLAVVPLVCAAHDRLPPSVAWQTSATAALADEPVLLGVFPDLLRIPALSVILLA